VRRFGPPPTRPRTGTLSLAVAGASPEAVATQLGEEGLFVSHGDFYATTVVERLGFSREGLLRIGLSCYSTQEEVDRVLGALDRVASTGT
jgi:selenocysteine lyase/cysteine desulfurase